MRTLQEARENQASIADLDGGKFIRFAQNAQHTAKKR